MTTTATATKKIQKRKKEIQQNGEVNDRFEKKYDEFNVKRKKRKGRKSYREDSSSSDEDSDQNQNCSKMSKKYNHQKKNSVTKNGTYQVPVKEVSDPATDFQKFQIMLGFYVYLIATSPSNQKSDG
eukprot:TRINITY_DN2706_c2_g2_i1.p6 TRINITY_DN2706_c2_g2~~TRINITY_DN2706_c2_g2_i1.p6  ORF type:complete len:126 (+),score=19.79 TRINITY_DN2706_c2_g2_i1:553-930(+)